MRLNETEVVTLGNGPRPAGKPDECFYCKEKVGQHHREFCVLRTRTVVVKATYEILVQVPQGWNAEDIEFHYTGSSSCANNLLNLLDEQAERLNNDGGCMCGFQDVVLLREATIVDHGTFRYQPDETLV